MMSREKRCSGNRSCDIPLMNHPTFVAEDFASDKRGLEMILVESAERLYILILNKVIMP
jgi:hypothetical protein